MALAGEYQMLAACCWAGHRSKRIWADWAADSIEHLLLQRQLRWLGHVIRMPSNRLTLQGITQWAAVAGCFKVALQGPHPSNPEQVQHFDLWSGKACNWQRQLEKCLCQQLEHTQLVLGSMEKVVMCMRVGERTLIWTSAKLSHTFIGTIQPSQQQLVLYVRSATESVLLSSACAAIFAVTRSRLPQHT